MHNLCYVAVNQIFGLPRTDETYEGCLADHNRRVAASAAGSPLAFGPSTAQGGESLATCIRPMHAGDNSRTLLTQAGDFDFDCTRNQSSYGVGDFWVLSQPCR